MNLTYDVYCELQRIYSDVVDEYGIPLWHLELGEPELVLYFDPDDELYGWYLPGEIGVNLARCETMSVAVATVLHEYKHFLQEPDRKDQAEYEREAHEFERFTSLFFSTAA